MLLLLLMADYNSFIKLLGKKANIVSNIDNFYSDQEYNKYFN